LCIELFGYAQQNHDVIVKNPKLVELVKHIDEEGKRAALEKALGDEDVNYKKEDLDVAIAQVQKELQPPENSSGSTSQSTSGTTQTKAENRHLVWQHVREHVTAEVRDSENRHRIWERIRQHAETT